MKLIRNVQLWGPGYVGGRLRAMLPWSHAPLEHIWVAMADHFEPCGGAADWKTAVGRVSLWESQWPAIARRCKPDSAGNPPRHTFFFPEEQYDPRLIEPLAEMTRQGLADVEVHLHHDGEGRQNFIDRITTFCNVLHEDHGLLRHRDGELAFGFIHGNWALDNSLPGGRWCGLNDEIQILHALGCYADFTMPSGDSPSQARQVNTIYYCTDDPNRPKSYDRGIPVVPGSDVAGELLMIPGPIGIRWQDRSLPRLETGELAAGNVATPYRASRWVDLAPRLERHAFLKLFTHGAQDQNCSALLGGGLETAFNLLVSEAALRNCAIHFVSAWQMYVAVDAIRQKMDPMALVNVPNAAASVKSRLVQSVSIEQMRIRHG